MAMFTISPMLEGLEYVYSTGVIYDRQNIFIVQTTD